MVRSKRTGKRLVRSRTRRAMSKAKVPAITKAFVKSAIKGTQETKYSDSQRLEQTSSTIGTIYYQDDMMTLDNNTTTSGKIGSLVNPLGMDLRWIVNNNSNAIGVFYRVLLLTNKLGRNNTAYRTGTGIFDVDGENQSISGTLYDMHRKINKDLYTVHYDQVYRLGTSAADASNFHNGKVYHKMSGKVRYDVQSGSPGAEPDTNNRVFLIITVEAPNDLALGIVTECTSNCRFYYKDP